MKLLSTKRNENQVQIICDEAVFDPSLAHLSLTDIEECIFKIDYDHAEYGHPLNLPFECSATSFYVKVTAHSVFVSLNAEVTDDINLNYEEYINEIGAIEFDARLTTDEKLSIVQFVLMSAFDSKTLPIINA